MKNQDRTADAAQLAVYSCPNSRRFRLVLRLLVAVSLGGFVVLLGTWIFRGPLLRGLVHAWIVDDDVTSADAVLVLCGGPNTRPFYAAGFYTNQVVQLVLVSTVKPNPSATLRVAEDENDINREILRRLGVPDSAVVRVGKDLTSTWEEAEAVAEWASTNRLRSIIIPTDWYHTRRVAWTFRQVLGDEIDVKLLAVPPLDYELDVWWQNENGVICFQNELIKLLVYRMTKRSK